MSDIPIMMARLQALQLQGAEPFNCDVCFEEDCRVKVDFLSCGHGVCQACYLEMSQRDVCPFCRAYISFTVMAAVNRRVHA
jgi:hypothetical protein